MIQMMIYPTIDMVATGNRIRRMREASGLTVEELVGLMGNISPQAYYKWQNGKCLPTVDNLLIMSQIFGTTIDELIAKEGDEMSLSFHVQDMERAA
jgi:transcriptional regulator with XRE-family HTH domain